MNSDTEAPIGMLLPWMPSEKAQVANTCVVSTHCLIAGLAHETYCLIVLAHFTTLEYGFVPGSQTL